MSRGLRLRLQRGFTAVEMIVAVAVGSMVMVSIFPMFLLLYRVQGAWLNTAQARAIGLTAETAVERDLRDYLVVGCAAGCLHQDPGLVLQGVPMPSQQTSPRAALCVSYAIRPTNDPTLPALVRSTYRPGQAGSPISRRTVGHGVTSLRASQSGAAVTVAMTMTAIGDTAPISINFVVSPRLGTSAIPGWGSSWGC
jgi:prepilin-type N-terminal cleavage/methylation domain-containing protein